MIGYFPTYTIGNLMAAQLWRALSAELPDIDASIAAGDFGPLREWLRDNIHRHGRKYTSRELLQRVTGEELRVEPFLEYLEGKLLDAGLLTAPGREFPAPSGRLERLFAFSVRPARRLRERSYVLSPELHRRHGRP